MPQCLVDVATMLPGAPTNTVEAASIRPEEPRQLRLLPAGWVAIRLSRPRLHRHKRLPTLVNVGTKCIPFQDRGTCRSHHSLVAPPHHHPHPRAPQDHPSAAHVPPQPHPRDRHAYLATYRNGKENIFQFHPTYVNKYHQLL